MNKILFAALLGFSIIAFTSCSDNKAAQNMQVKEAVKKIDASNKSKKQGLVKEDGAAIGFLETDTYVMKLHRAFTYSPEGSEILAGMKPKQGTKFIYLDVSLRNKSTEKLNGGFLFIALKVTDEKGVEYKKPAAGLAAYTTDHPEESNTNEYNALWEDFAPNEFHRDVIYCVEVPAATNSFVLHMPTDRKRKEWKTVSFTVK